MIDGRLKCRQFPAKNELTLATFCAQTQSDDCIRITREGKSRSGEVIAQISYHPNGVVAVTRAGRFFCGVSDTRISKSYLTCGKTGWQVSAPGYTNTDNPWNPTDVFEGAI